MSPVRSPVPATRKKHEGPSKLDDVDAAMELVNCDNMFPNVAGQVLINDDTLALFDNPSLVKKPPKRTVVRDGRELKLIRAFTNLQARDAYHLKNGLEYESVTDEMLTTSSGALKVVHTCRYFREDRPKDMDPNCREREKCLSCMIEYRYPEIGLILMYEETHSACVHGSLGESQGLGTVKEREVLRLKGHTLDAPTIKADLDSKIGRHKANRCIPKVARKIGDFLRKHKLTSGSGRSAEETQKVFTAKQKKMEEKIGEKVVFKAVNYFNDPTQAGLIITSKSWLQNGKDSKVLFEDATFIKHSKHSNDGKESSSHLIALTTIAKNGQIRPVAFCTAPEENLTNIETFLRTLLTQMAAELEIEFPQNADGTFCFPNLKYFVADGILGMNNLVADLFGPHVIRIACYFHVLQGLVRWLKAPGLKEEPGFKFCAQVESYMIDVMRQLSLCENVPEFMLEWAFWRKAMLEKQAGGSAVWAHADKLVTHFEKKLIFDDDSNCWCKALIGPQQKYLGRVIRSTRSESFFSSLKRIINLRNSGTYNLDELQTVLMDFVAYDVYENYKVIKDKVIPAKDWDAAWLLLELYKSRYDGERVPKVDENFAYHYESGMFFSFPGNRNLVKATWVHKGDRGVLVTFSDMEEFVLKKKGFCIVSGPLTAKGRMAPDWHQHAVCSCQEFLSSSGTPCVIILALSLMLNKQLDQDEFKKVQLGNAAFEALLKNQIAVQLSGADGYRYPNGGDSQKEFVRHMCVLKAQSDRNFMQCSRNADYLTSQNPGASLQAAASRAILDFSYSVKPINRYIPPEADKLYYPDETRLLRNMSIRFREMVRCLPCTNHVDGLALPEADDRRRSNRGQILRQNRASFSAGTPRVTEAKSTRLKRRKAREKRWMTEKPWEVTTGKTCLRQRRNDN